MIDSFYLYRVSGVINDIEKSTKEQLSSVDYVIDLIRRMGLHADPRMAYKYGEINAPFIRNPGMLQIPGQLAEYLVFLSNRHVDTYFEIGSFNGISAAFVSAYLGIFNPKLKFISIDISPKRPLSEMRKLLDGKVKFVTGTSMDFRGLSPDVCFIDGDHSYEAIVSDYENVGSKARICAFHDIVDKDRDSKTPVNIDAIKFHNELKKQGDYEELHEFIKHPDNKEHFGIGVFIRSTEAVK